ncbi:hypothetical protein ZOSMA_335G00040 [Zostera marina]|uniref:F-box domain-containing protein n=1 Tax=Zostera marina TaxID=29655 RepID=A0A0K9P863_ZOSMR|nr:hypothetical protein ZOSMA_335G00040 [Zostera marina]
MYITPSIRISLASFRLNMMSQNDFYIPEELTMNILSFLPAKEVCKNRILCKSVLENSKFWKSGQLHLSRVRDKFEGVIISCNYDYEGPSFNSVQHFSNDEYQIFPEEFVLPNKGDKILGCTDGLLIYNIYHQWIRDGVKYYEYENHYFQNGFAYINIINPMIHDQIRNISYPPSTCRYMDFVRAEIMFDEEKFGNYKLICFATTNEWSENDVRFNCCEVGVCDDVGIFVYCSRKDTWTVTKYSQLDIVNRLHINPDTHIVLIDKTVYFVTKSPSFAIRPFIFGITIDDNGVDLKTIQKISLPSDLDIKNHRILMDIAHWRKVKKNPTFCLTFFENGVFRVWIMDDLKNGIWSKQLVDISIESMGFSSLVSRRYAHEFMIINDDTLVFYQNKRNWKHLHMYLYMYNWKTGEKDFFSKKLKKITWFTYVTKFFPYTNTLLTCN